MKKVKTLIAVILCMFATAIFGACSCSEPDVSVVSMKIASTSNNLFYDAENDKYLVRHGDTFTISFELLPNTATDKTVYVTLTPANKIVCDTPIINNPIANEETGNYDVLFKATANSGDTLIEFESKDGGKKASILVEVVANLSMFSTPTNLAYNEITETLSWDKCVAETANGTEYATAYEIIVNDKDKYVAETNSFNLPMDSGKDYFVKIKALGVLADRTGDSPYCADCNFHIASTPTNFKTLNERGHLYWEYSEPDRISEFVLDYGGDNTIRIPTNGTKKYTFDFANYVFTNDLPQDNFNVKITAINPAYTNGAPEEETGITTHIKNSRGNPQLSLTKLKAPTNLRINTTKGVGSIFTRSVLTWDNVAKAEYYDVRITKKSTGEEIDRNNRKVGNSLDLTSLIDSVGEYQITIVPKGDIASTFSHESYVKTTYDFVVVPLLTGSINYSSDMLTLDTASLIDTLGISPGNLDQLDYELYYSTSGVGQYDNVVNMTASQEINLSQIVNQTNSEFNILVRPVGTERYTAKNIVMSQVKNIEENKTVSGWITQLKPINVINVDKTGVINAVDTNIDTRLADRYKFLLFDGNNTTTQMLYRNNLTFDAQDSTKFSTSIVNLFQITNPQDYSVKIIPMSSTALDANENSTTSFEFTQLGKVDAGSILINNKQITWNNVDNFYAYNVSINGAEPSNVTTNSYVIDDIASLTDNNTISISAMGNDINTINGGTTIINRGRALPVSNVRIKDGTLMWDNDVANSVFYVYISYPEGEPIEVRCDSNVFTGLDQITADVTVNIVRSVPTSFNSVESDDYNLVRLATPTADLELINNTYNATFSAVGNCDNYKITIYKGGELKKTHNITLIGSTPSATISGGKVNFTLPTLDAGDYTIYIQSLPSDQSNSDYQTNDKYYLISEVSQSSELVIYPQVEISSKTHELSWTLDSVNGVKDFVIDFADNSINDITTAEYSYGFDELEGGSYVLSIYATSTKTNVVYATPVNVTITKAGITTLNFADGRIYFTAVDNASQYEVYNHNDELLTQDTDYTLESGAENTIYIRPKNASTSMVSSMYIVAIGAEDIIDGEKSESISYKQINATQNVLMTSSGNVKTFTWDAVENNGGYQVVIKDKVGATLSTDIVDTNSYNIPEKFITGAKIFEAGTYTFEITVIGDKDNGVHLINSSACTQSFTKLAEISNVVKVNDAITWEYNGEAMPVSYYITIWTMDDKYNWNKVYTTSITNITDSTASFDLSNIEHTGYIIKIASIGSDETFTISSADKTLTKEGGETWIFVRATAPQLDYANGIVTFAYDNDAESYEIYHFDGENYNQLTSGVDYNLANDDINEKYTLEILDASEVYNISIKTIAKSETGKLTSSYSTPVKISKLTTITDLSINNAGIISWSIVSNASGYLLINMTTSQQHPFNGEISNVRFDSLGLSQGDECEFRIMPLGAYNGENGVHYLNGDLSNTITISAIENVAEGSLEIENGVISWGAVEGAESYSIEIYEKTGDNSYSGLLKSLVVTNATSVDVTNVAQILPSYETVVARIKPISTIDNQYVMLDTLTHVEIPFSRYNAIKNISIYNGLIKFTIDLSKVEFSHMLEIISATDYADLSEEIRQRYYGYYNFKIDIAGSMPLNITLNDMLRYDYDLLALELYAYYELGYFVENTKQLDIRISSIGNYGAINSEHNAIPSLPSTSNGTILTAYKHVAPKPTAGSNLIASDGTIVFRKIRMADDREFANKYVLSAREGTRKMYYIFEIPSDHQGESYTLNNLFSIDFLLDVNNGTPSIVNLDYNLEYIFNLTTLGTEVSVSGQIPYLRSNPYREMAITFLYDESGLAYRYQLGDIHGGHLNWQANSKCMFYNLYILKETDANYGVETENVKTHSLWIDNPKATVVRVEKGQTEFMFDNMPIDDGATYWCAVRPMGNDENFISSPVASQTIVVYKLKPVINQELLDGTFSWVIGETNTSSIAGFGVVIKVYHEDSSGPVNVIYRSQLLPADTLRYTLEKEVVGTDGETYELNGVTDGGVKELYGIEIYAVGNFHNGIQAVASGRKTIDNMNTGYARLDALTIAVNMSNEGRCIEWSVDEAIAPHIKSYSILNDDMVINNILGRSVEFDSLTSAGDYNIEVVALANGNRYLNSIESNMIELIKYYPPEFVVSGGGLTWDSALNGAALRPYTSNIQIYKDGVKVGQDIVSEQPSVVLGDGFQPGEYTIRVRYNDYEKDGVYSIASTYREVVVNKLAAPVVESVDNYSNPEERECEQFASALKWNYVIGKNSEKITRYLVEFLVYDDPGYRVIKTLEFENAQYDHNMFYEDVANDYIYLNISNLASELGFAYGIGSVNVLVSAVGNDVNRDVIETGIYLAYLTSDNGVFGINYSIGAPSNASSDIQNGILKWSGADDLSATDDVTTPDPVLITMTYNNGGSQATEQVYLSVDYINTYGKVYYLPYMTSYSSVFIQFVLGGGTSLSNSLQLTFDTQDLFNSGDGSIGNPYIVTNNDQFKNIQYRPVSYIKIDESVSELVIDDWSVVENFGGNLIGYRTAQGSSPIVKINHINPISTSQKVYSALFKNITSDASIKNINFEFVNLQIYSSNGNAYNVPIEMASLAINNAGYLHNIGLTGTMTGFSRHTVVYGGVVVNNNGVLSGITANQTIVIKSESSLANDGLFAGGITYNNENIIKNSLSTSTINLNEITTTKQRKVGGVAFSNTGLIINTDFRGKLTAWDMAGITIYNTYNSKDINLTEKYIEDASPISVDYKGGTILGCSSTGNFTYYYDKNCSMEESSAAYIGGIVGINRGGKIGACYSDLKGDTSNNNISANLHKYCYIGGLVGSNNVNNVTDKVYPSIENSYAIVSCTITNTGNRGAVVGTYGSTTGTGISYSARNYCLTNVMYVSDNYGPIGGVNSADVTITKTSQITSQVNTLNNAMTTDEYKHVRRFAVSGSDLILTQAKTIEN